MNTAYFNGQIQFICDFNDIVIFLGWPFLKYNFWEIPLSVGELANKEVLSFCGNKNIFSRNADI